MKIGKPIVNLMELGRNKLCAPGLENKEIRERFEEALGKSDGNATTYPIDHVREHGSQHYFIRGMLSSFDPGAVLEVAREGGVMAMATLPALGRVIGRMTKGEMPLIWKMNDGAGAKKNGDYVTVRQYNPLDIDLAVKIAIDHGARFFGATIYTGSANQAEMVQQLTELDAVAYENGLGLVVWNYPRGNGIPAGHDADVFFQLNGAEVICNACPSSLVLIKEKVSTRPGTVEEWRAGKLTDLGRTSKDGWGKPGFMDISGFDEDAVEEFMQLSRAEQIALMVGLQHDYYGVASLMSGGAPQEPEQFARDVEDGLGLGRHIAFIAGRSTTRQIVKKDDGSFDVSAAVAHMHMLREAAPRVVIED